MASTYDSSTSSIDKMYSALSNTLTLRSNAATTSLSSGITLMQNKQYKQAAGVFRMATAYDPTNTDAYNLMAQAYVGAGDNKKAIEAYKLSIKIYTSGQSSATGSDTKDQIQIKLANLYIQEKRPVDAEKELRAAIKSNPQNVVAPYTLGQLLVQQNRPQEAEGFFRSAVKLAPNDGNAFYGLGLSLSQQNKTDEAIETLQKAVSLKKDFTTGIYELGNAYSKNGQKEQVQTQIDLLGKIDTAESNSYASILKDAIKQPGIVMINNTSKSSFNPLLGYVPLISLDSQFIQPDASADVSVTFLFDSDMDPASVNDISNWTIRKAQGASINQWSGLYDNGMYRSTDSSLPPMPSRVIYDPTTQEATIYFSLRQNSSLTGTVDTSGVVFSFNGKDMNGKKMDSAADQISGYSKDAF